MGIRAASGHRILGAYAARAYSPGVKSITRANIRCMDLTVGAGVRVA
jgi:hypothetical protein